MKVDVQKAGSTTALSISATKLDLGKTATLIANVTGPGVIGGTVRFLDGANMIGTITVDANGKAMFSTTTLMAGSHALAASYAGDANHNASASAAATLEVVAPDFSLSANTASQSVAAGQRATYTVTVMPVGRFNSAVTFSCSGLPQLTSCAFSPQSVTPAGAGVPTTMTLTTTGPASAAVIQTPSGLRPLYAMWLAITCAPTLIMLGNKRTRQWLTLLAILIVIGLVSCGGGSSSTPAPRTPSGTYTVTVSGSAGATSRTTQVALEVK